jgi:hypothetical protein
LAGSLLRLKTAMTRITITSSTADAALKTQEALYVGTQSKNPREFNQSTVGWPRDVLKTASYRRESHGSDFHRGGGLCVLTLIFYTMQKSEQPLSGHTVFNPSLFRRNLTLLFCNVFCKNTVVAKTQKTAFWRFWCF